MSEPMNPQPPPVTPYLTVANAHGAIEFYKRAFGATLLNSHATPDGSKLIHAALSINGGLVMLSDDFPEMTGGKATNPQALGGTPVVLHLNLADVDATWKQAVEAGARVVMPLADQFWGDRYGQLDDPFGHRWSLATPKRKPTEEEMKPEVEKHFPSNR